MEPRESKEKRVRLIDVQGRERWVTPDEICGAIVYTYPGIGVAGRRQILPKMKISELNRELSNIMRVVVHPKYRTIGLGQKLVRETLDVWDALRRNNRGHGQIQSFL
jgi:ABC-type ATPase with predicted acetyltransferase domain